MSRATLPERLSSFLRGRLDELRTTYGVDSARYLGLARQYLWDPREEDGTRERNLKHYEAGVDSAEETGCPVGLERLYRRTLVIEPTLSCVANCRYCLRSNYPRHTLTERQLLDVAQYCGTEANRNIVNEVLITGGDPLLIPHRVDALLRALVEHAPNVRIVRIASRIPTQSPEHIDRDVVSLFKNRPMLRFELATQINHPEEFHPECVAALERIQAAGATVYAQNVLLKGVNDDPPTLVELYDLIRQHGIEAHYLFHAVPLVGTHHLRTSVERGISLARELTSCGRISGRSKPMFSAMTDIGKITFYDGSIVARDGPHILLQSDYRLVDRMTNNPSWKLPEAAEVDADGRLRVWYLDGED